MGGCQMRDRRELNMEKLESTSQRKPYEKPKIILELALETRAGSPLRNDPLDPYAGG